MRSTGRRERLAAGLLALALALLRGPLEATMSVHMLVQLPLLAAAGALLAGPALARAMASVDEDGVTGLSALLFVSAYWMIPRTLELSLTAPSVECAKLASIVAVGAVLPGSLARANTVVQLFFLGNFCSMTAVAGMLYQDMATRLCNAYTLDDQARAGMGLVAWALLVAALWCGAHLRLYTTPARSALMEKPQ